MNVTIKPWPRADLISTIVAVACLTLVEIVFLVNWIAPSAVVAGCSVAVVGRYLHQIGYSLHQGPLRNRGKAFGILVLVILVAGSIGTLVFGR